MKLPRSVWNSQDANLSIYGILDTLKCVKILISCLGLIHSLFILALIPFARRLEGFLPPLNRFVLLGVLLAALILFSRRARSMLMALARSGWREIGGLFLLLALIRITLRPATIEYFHVVLYGSLFLSWSVSIRVLPQCVGAKSLQLSPKLLNGISFTLCQLVSISDEWLQWLHPERVYDNRDLLLNFLATLMGWLFFRLGRGIERPKGCSVGELRGVTQSYAEKSRVA